MRAPIGNVAFWAPFVCLAMLWVSVPVLMLMVVFAMPLALIASMRDPAYADELQVPDYVPDHLDE